MSEETEKLTFKNRLRNIFENLTELAGDAVLGIGAGYILFDNPFYGLVGGITYYGIRKIPTCWRGKLLFLCASYWKLF